MADKISPIDVIPPNLATLAMNTAMKTYVVKDSGENLSINGRHVFRFMRDKCRSNAVYDGQLLGG